MTHPEAEVAGEEDNILWWPWSLVAAYLVGCLLGNPEAFIGGYAVLGACIILRKDLRWISSPKDGG